MSESVDPSGRRKTKFIYITYVLVCNYHNGISSGVSRSFTSALDSKYVIIVHPVVGSDGPLIFARRVK
jgi:hypothetical protein